MDLALPVEDGWLPVTFGDHSIPADGMRFAAEAESDACLREIQARFVSSPWGLFQMVQGLRGHLSFAHLFLTMIGK